MRPRMILAIARKDALDFWLDKSKVGVLLIPLFLGCVWLIISHLTPSSSPTTLLVYNPGQSALPQVVASSLPDAQITVATSSTQVSAAFAANRPQSSHAYDMGLIIPADFEGQLRAGEQPHVTLYLNGATQDAQQRAFVQAVVLYYARTVATPHPPVTLVTQAVNIGASPANPPSLGVIYSIVMLPLSLVVGLNVLPGLIIEEREKKTLRWLLASPASLGDILLGKVLVTLAYQLALSLGAMALIGGFGGDVPLLLLYTLLGAFLALALGLLLGVLCRTTSAAQVISGVVILLFILPAVIVPLEPFVVSNAIINLLKALPTTYLADGASNAIQRMGSFGSNLLDVGVILATTLVVVLIAAWALRRQAAVASQFSH